MSYRRHCNCNLTYKSVLGFDLDKAALIASAPFPGPNREDVEPGLVCDELAAVLRRAKLRSIFHGSGSSLRAGAS